MKKKVQGFQLISEQNQEREAAKFNLGMPWSSHYEWLIHSELGSFRVFY